MNTVIGEILPLAVAVAISPVPIIATILMLMSPRAKAMGFSFLGGWVLGIVVAVTAFTLLAGIIPEPSSGESQPIVGVIQLVLGAALLFMSVRQWRGRPHSSEDAELPKWMSAIDTMKPSAALGLAFLLSAVNPKNLLLAVAAGTAIGRSELEVSATVVVVAVFVVIAAISVAVPVVGYSVAPQKAEAMLGRVREWLTMNNATIMAVLMLVIGAQLLGKGIGSF